MRNIANSVDHTSFILVMVIVLALVVSPVSSQEAGETVIIKVENNRFSPAEVTVNVGDIVIFVWQEGAEGHNVVQVERQNSLTPLENGFDSGEPASAPFDYTIPDKFLGTDATLHFICEPHASTGMVGMITVGDGGTEDEAQAGLVAPLLAFAALPVLRRHAH